MLEVECSENSLHYPLLEKGHCNYGTETEARRFGSSFCHDSLCALTFCASPFPGLETANCTSLPLNNSQSNAAQGPSVTAAWHHCLCFQGPSISDGRIKMLFLNAGFCARRAAHVWTEQVRVKHEELSTGALSGKRGKRWLRGGVAMESKLEHMLLLNNTQGFFCQYL